MKTLNITLVIKANNRNEAELYGKIDLMELTKLVGMYSGSMIASCEGDAKPIRDDLYKVEAKMQIDGNANVDRLIEEVQIGWSSKPRILSSSIFTTEEKPEPIQKPRGYEAVTCESCGQVMVKGYENIVNPGLDEEYCLCNSCFEGACNAHEIIQCECCTAYIETELLVKNPVTGEQDLCPCCGNKLIF